IPRRIRSLATKTLEVANVPAIPVATWPINFRRECIWRQLLTTEDGYFHYPSISGATGSSAREWGGLSRNGPPARTSASQFLIFTQINGQLIAFSTNRASFTRMERPILVRGESATIVFVSPVAQAVAL